MSAFSDQLIVALDVDDAGKALRIVDALGKDVTFYKVGMQLYFAEGNTFIRELQARKKKIFLDLKINDIPETVAKAVGSVVTLGVEYLTLFTQPAQIQAARAVIRERGSDLKLLNVTVLTSEASTFETVKARAAISLDAGADGLICSGHETAGLRKEFGNNCILVNPGIRPAAAEKNDQVRIVTPTQAIAAGATNLVVGRPITGAADPGAAARAILAEIEAAHQAGK